METGRTDYCGHQEKRLLWRLVEEINVESGKQIKVETARRDECGEWKNRLLWKLEEQITVDAERTDYCGH